MLETYLGQGKGFQNERSIRIPLGGRGLYTPGGKGVSEVGAKVLMLPLATPRPFGLFQK